MKIEELKDLRKQTVSKLAEIEVLINKYKQSEFKFNEIAQENLIYLKDERKFYQKVKKKIDKRLKEGFI